MYSRSLATTVVLQVYLFRVFWSSYLIVRPFLELPDLQTFFCPFSVLRIFRFLALPEIAHFRFEISGNRFSARARAENLVPKMF